MNVIVDSGIIPHEWVKKALKDTPYIVFFVGDDKDINNLEIDIQGTNNLRYTELAKRSSFKNIQAVKSKYNFFYNKLISDYRTLLISERTFPTLKPWDCHAFSQLPILSRMICAYIDYLEEVNPSFVFFHATPHNLFSYVFGRVAELMGIDVYLSKTTPLPWKSWLVKGLDANEIIEIGNVFIKDNPKRLEDYYALNSSKYEEAIPSYEKRRIEARKGKIWSWKTELKEAIHSPHRIVAVLKKYKNYKLYQSMSTTDVNVGKYVIVFLHYQPERTSLPEGSFFTQQSHLIRTLSLGLPEDYTILVKEHPTMFTGSIDIRYRNKWFYEDIASMKNVRIVDIGIDSFTLSDKARCVATITGTVGVESLIRGKAVLAFGLASYRGFKYCYQINNANDVSRAIAEIENLNTQQVSSEFKKYLYETCLLSVNGIDDEGLDGRDYYNQTFRLNADGKVLYSLLCNQFKRSV